MFGNKTVEFACVNKYNYLHQLIWFHIMINNLIKPKQIGRVWINYFDMLIRFDCVFVFSEFLNGTKCYAVYNNGLGIYNLVLKIEKDR